MSASEVLPQVFHMYSNKELVDRSNPNPAFGTDSPKSITHPNTSKISPHSGKNRKVSMTPSTRNAFQLQQGINKSNINWLYIHSSFNAKKNCMAS